MKCTNHPKSEAEKNCVGCGNPFCDDCLTKVKNKNYCASCLEEKVSTADAKPEAVKPEIIVTQTQTNTGGSNNGFLDKVAKACCIIIFLIIALYIILIMIGLGLR